MKGPVRTEFLSQNAVTVFPESDPKYPAKCPMQFARQIAALKNVQSYSEPFYVMEMGKVYELCEQWHYALPRVQPFYSIQCNSDPVLLKLLASNRFMGFNCANNQTLNEALDFLPASRILYSNPILTRASLKEAAEKNVQLISFQSSRDLDRIMMYHPNAELLLNICVNEESEDPNALMSCAVEEAPELMELASNSGANLVGISFNVGSGCTRPALYSSAIEVASKLFHLGSRFGFSMQVLNIGCGFSNKNNFNETCAYINDSLDYYFPAEGFPNLRIMATPGRFFAGSVFSLVTNITGRRSVALSHLTNDDFDNGREAFIYEINEGFYGGFGCRLNANIEPECTPLFDHYLDGVSNEHVYGSVVGPALDESDVIQPLCRFRPMATGDWLMWRDMGAYSLNNRGSLTDEEDNSYQSPMIFYFTSQSQWEQMEFCKGESIPSSPVHSEFGGSDYGADSLASVEDYEEDAMSIFDWPLHD